MARLVRAHPLSPASDDVCRPNGVEMPRADTATSRTTGVPISTPLIAGRAPSALLADRVRRGL